jgi:hypothetical protein
LTIGLAIAPLRASAQDHQAKQIQISRDFHDLSWVATGTALTLTLKELGVETREASLIGTFGVVTAVKMVKCIQWCGRADVNWPASVAIKDGVYDAVLTNGVLPVLIGKRYGWQKGVVTGLAWIGSILVMREVRWNSS